LEYLTGYGIEILTEQNIKPRHNLYSGYVGFGHGWVEVYLK